MSLKLKKQELDKWLDEVDYSYLTEGDYVPTEFALKFMAFVKMVNGEAGEGNKTPPVHLAMLDKVVSESPYVANLVFRGAAKTTLFAEYLSLFIATFGRIDGFGDVPFMIYVSDSMDNGVKSARENTQHRYDKSAFMQYWVPHAKFTDKSMEFRNKDGHDFCVMMYGAKTGIRGAKRFGQRPVLAILDDLVGDEEADSAASMEDIKNTVYKGIEHAMDPNRYKIIMNGTPFNKDDVLVEAVESGGWDANVWPVCEKFPCEEKDFKSAWPDRFTYKLVKQKYDHAVATGKLPAFLQELMLRISGDENRMVLDSDIRWYSRAKLLKNKSQYNFYITTDIAVSDDKKANQSVISVWAYSASGEWFWVDGICHRKLIDVTWNELFRLVSEYKPVGVGIEVSGQQKAFIKHLQSEMMTRNIWFNFLSSEKSNDPGIRPHTNKLVRFNIVVPWFKSGKMHFPEEMKFGLEMGECMGEIRLVTTMGIKGRDDFLDSISQLGYISPWKPSDNSGAASDDSGPFPDEPTAPEESKMSSYIV